MLFPKCVSQLRNDNMFPEAILNKIVFSIEYFTADFSQFSSNIVKICFMVNRLGNRHEFQAFQRYSENF